MEISERIKELMMDKGIDSQTLSKELGVSESTVSRWKNSCKSMRLSSALKIADYFNCSLDFLVGRSEKIMDFMPQKPYPLFYENLRNLMKKKNITRYEIHVNTKIKSSHFVDWSRGSDPHILSLIELADYLEITLDCLAGREK